MHISHTWFIYYYDNVITECTPNTFQPTKAYLEPFVNFLGWKNFSLNLCKLPDTSLDPKPVNLNPEYCNYLCAYISPVGSKVLQASRWATHCFCPKLHTVSGTWLALEIPGNWKRNSNILWGSWFSQRMAQICALVCSCLQLS